MEKKFYIYIKDEEHTINPYKQEDIIDIDFWEARDFVRLCVADKFYKKIYGVLPTDEQKKLFERELSRGYFDELALDYTFFYAITHDEIFIKYVEKYIERDLRYGYDVDVNDLNDFGIQEETEDNDKWYIYTDSDNFIIRENEDLVHLKHKKRDGKSFTGSTRGYYDGYREEYTTGDGILLTWDDSSYTHPLFEEYGEEKEVEILDAGVPLKITLLVLDDWNKQLKFVYQLYSDILEEKPMGEKEFVANNFYEADKKCLKWCENGNIYRSFKGVRV